MAAQSEHGRLITAAAKAALRSHGFKRRGQSRVYIADNRFWLTMIEFQPSGYSKGSFLNCYAHWLWGSNDHSFDYGGRVNGFVPFETIDQFASDIAGLVAAAAEAALKLQSELSSIRTVAGLLVTREDELVAARRGGSWPAYNAAIASALAGEREASHRMFVLAAATPGEMEWEQSLRNMSSEFGSLLRSSPERLRERLLGLIAQGRLRFGLLPDPECVPSGSTNASK